MKKRSFGSFAFFRVPNMTTKKIKMSMESTRTKKYTLNRGHKAQFSCSPTFVVHLHE